MILRILESMNYVRALPIPTPRSLSYLTHTRSLYMSPQMSERTFTIQHVRLVDPHNLGLLLNVLADTRQGDSLFKLWQDFLTIISHCSSRIYDTQFVFSLFHYPIPHNVTQGSYVMIVFFSLQRSASCEPSGRLVFGRISFVR